MYGVRRYSKAILLCSLTNPEFKLLTILFLKNMAIDDHNIDPIPNVLNISETFNPFRYNYLFHLR